LEFLLLEVLGANYLLSISQWRELDCVKLEGFHAVETRLPYPEEFLLLEVPEANLLLSISQ
jgi:hypothetical protein